MYDVLHEGSGPGLWRGNESMTEPTKWDILTGRDQMSIRHTGNRCFRELIRTSLEEYKTLSAMTEKKNKFCNAIVESIQASGGRFLRRQPENGGWEAIDHEEAKVKVRRAFRDAMAMRRNRPKTSQGGVSPVTKPTCISAGFFDWNGLVLNAESANTPCPRILILEPTDLDILHGRDDFSIYHIGNSCFRSVIGCLIQYYAMLTTRSEKSEFLSAVVNTIHNAGGRFLRRRPRGEGWEQDDFQEAKQTVGQALRDLMKKPKIHLESSLLSLADLFYQTAHEFDWRAMVKTAHSLELDTQKCSLRDNSEDNWEVDLTLNSDCPLFSLFPYDL